MDIESDGRASVGPDDLKSLVEARLAILKIDEPELMSRLGYSKVEKFRSHFSDILDGTRSRPLLISRLPAALEVTRETVLAAVAATERSLRERERQRYAENFQAHAVLICERTRPEPLFVAAVIGIENIMVIKFDLDADPQTFLQQALDVIAERRGSPALDTNPKPFLVPAFGKVLGFAINYSPEHAVQFDLEGRSIARLNRAVRLGSALVTIE